MVNNDNEDWKTKPYDEWKKPKDYVQIIPASEIQVLAMEYTYKYRVRLMLCVTAIVITIILVVSGVI